MRLGTAQAIITPPIGTPLAGFGSRDHGSEGVLDDVEVRALWLQEGDSAADAVCIITADLLGIETDMTAEMRSELSRETGISPDRILLAASHTHSAQQVLKNIVGTGDPIPSVVASTQQRILETAKESRENLRAVTMHAGRGNLVGFSINRRVLKDGVVHMIPNPDGIRDDEVMVISYRDEISGEVAAVLFQFTCHPSTICTYDVTADYPGVARRHIEGALGNGAVAAFLPGCFGNVRTNATIVGGSMFRGGTVQDITAFGSALGTEVLRVLKEDSTQLEPSLGGSTSEISLELAGYPSQEKLDAALKSDNKIERAWAAKTISEPPSTTRPFSIQRIDLSKKAMLVAMSGEVVCEYGHFIKELHLETFAVPMGYSNGVLSYIPTAKIIAEGGYEGDQSSQVYGLPSVFKPEIEDKIKEAIRELMA